MTIRIKSLNTNMSNFERQFSSYIKSNNAFNKSTQDKVDKIVSSIKKNGDKALLKYINELDGYKVHNINSCFISQTQIKKAYKFVTKQQITALRKSIKRIKAFSQKQLSRSWSITNDGSMLGEKVTAISSVAIYVPAGKASYPSTVLMNTIPAKVAGVKNIIMVSPIDKIENHALAVVAADLCGVDKILRIGGAHAIAALAYGTKKIDQVDKIVGPGNIYVTLAKKIVYGDVGIDNIAGPSEIVIVADESNNPEWIAMDLFSQAEHDELAQPILISKNAKLLNKVREAIKNLLPSMPRKKIILKSLNNRGLFVKVKNFNEIISIVNRIAPEHLEIMSKDYKKISKFIQNAGAIFLGEYSTEAFGDYCAGPNHVLPTSGSARFSSPLGVYDFQKRSSLIKISKKTAAELSKISSSIAIAEGLYCHAMAAKYRE